MKITFTALGAVRSTLEYFLSEAGYAPRAGTGTGKRACYYAGDTGEHLHASAWFGRGAEALGLTGRVRARDFERVLRGEVPGADVVLRRNRDGAQEHRTGWDMTVSAPKSVSVAWGVQGDERVLGEFVESVRSAFRVMEARHLETRVYDPETKRRERVAADGLVMATFVHVSNRNDEPQVHLHGVVLNMTRSARGEWRSLEPTPLARHARLLGNIAGNALAGRLRGLGYAIAARRIGRLQSFEIAGYPRWLLDRFSTRRGEILRHLAETGRRLSTRTAQVAAFATRRRKSGLRTQALREQWRAQVEAEPRLEQALVGALYESHRAAPGDAPVPTALESVCRAVDHLAERTTLLRERDILATALLLEPGRHGLDALEAALERRLRDRHLLEARAYRGGGRAFVASREFADERALVAWMKAGRGTGRALAARDAVEARLGDIRHTAGQKEAVRLILLAPHRAVAVQGFAGTGKTTMLREVVGLAGGVPVFGLAPSAAAARVLGHEAGIGARTVDWFLTRFGTLRTGEACPATRALARELCGDGILVVDESSMLSTAQLRALARLAERIGVARVVLCGDHRQLQSVRPGQPFRLLQEAGMSTAVMDEIVRQRNPVIRKAVRDALAGRPARALARLAERVEEVPAQALAETAAREFLALPDAERDATLLVAPTHALRRDINAVVREGLVEEGKIRGPALVVERLIDLHFTAAEKAQLSSYQPDDEVVFVQDLLHYRVRNAEACVVTGVDGARVALRHPDGKPRHIAPAGRIRYHIKICESAPIELRAGDRIRWTHNDHRRGLLNGEHATVERIGERDVTLRTEGGTKHVLDATDPQLRHIDHAYAATTHAAQGSTCERVIAVLDADPMPLTNQLTFYVQISRAREEVVLLTDDLEQLIETLEEQSGERMSAHEALGATPEGGGAAARARRRGYERVRREWRRVRRRARIEQRPERYASGYAEVHEQVARLDEDDALPGYLRRFVDDWLGDHAQGERQLRDIETVIREARRRARGPPAGGQEDARDDADAEASGDGGAGEALALARTIAGDALAYGPHLDADDALRERFDAAHPVLEAAAFANAHATIERHAAETRTIKCYASGYAALLDDATRLDRADLPLDPDTRALVSEVLREDEQRRGERERIEAFIESAQSWEGALAPEARWDHSGAALLEQGRIIPEDTSQFDAHLQGDEDLGGRFGSARGALETAAFHNAHASIDRQATTSRKIAFYAPDYGALIQHATALQRSKLALAEQTKALVSKVLRDDAQCRGERDRIQGFIAAVQTWEEAQAREGRWDDSGAALLEQGRSIHEDTSQLDAHLQGDEDLGGRFGSARAALETAAFHNAHASIDRQATTSRKIAFYAPDYGALIQHATALQRSKLALAEQTKALVSKVLRDDAQCRGERDRIQGFIAAVQTWEETQAREGGWDDSGAALLEQGRSIHEDTSQFDAHLQGDENLGRRFGSARAALETAAFVSAHRNVMREATEDGTIAFVVRDFPELLDHARRVHESTLALPEDIRTLATGVLREAAERQRDVRRIERFLACARRRAAVRTRDPTWTRRDEALLRRARILATDQNRYAPHLAANADLRQALDATHAAFEAAAFANEHETVRRQAVEGHTIAFYAPGYGALLERATALSESTLPLDADTRALVSEVLREDEQRRGERERIEGFIAAVQIWVEDRAPEAKWDQTGAALLEQGRKVHEDTSQLDAHLQADEDLRGRFGSARAALETAAFHSTHQAVAREAAASNVILFYAPGYAALAAHATRLEVSELPLDAGTRARATTVARQDAPLREEVDRIAQCITDAERWKTGLAGGARWDDGGRAALVRARAIHDDTSSSHPHLVADDTLRQAFEAAYAGLEAAAFNHEHETVKARAAADHTIAFYAPGYAALLDDANRLGESELPLDADTRALACTVSRQDPQHRTEADRIKQCMGDVAAWREGQPEQGKWDDAGAALLDRIRSIASNTAAYGPHLAADDVLRKGFERFQFELQLRAFIKQNDIVEWQAAESMKDRYFVPAYPALLDHATHIARSRNPRYGDYLTETREIVRQGAERRAEAHAIRTWIVGAEAWREGQPATGRWDEAGMALRVRAHEIEANEFTHDRHLAADDTVCRDYEAARGALEAAAIRDAFESVERQVAAGDGIAFYAPDYGVLLRHARALEHSELPLPEDTEALVCEVLRENAARRGERERIEGFIAAAQTWEAERASEAKGDETGAALLEQAGAILEDTPPLQPHLEGDPKLRRRFQGAFGALNSAKICNDYVALENEAARRGTTPFHVPGHGELLARVHRLRRLNMPLPKEAQRLADRVVREDAQAREALRHIDTFLEDAERRHRERARGSPWGEQDEALWRRALEIDDDEGRCRVHLDAIDFMPARFERACCVLEAEADHHAHDSAATRRSPQAEQDRPYALDYTSLVFHVSGLTQAVRTAPDTAEEALAEQRIDEPAGPHRQRTLEEFFAWCAFRRLERERGSDNDWNELDEALWEHAQVVNAGIIPDDAAYFDDAESRRRFEQAHADLAGRAFCEADEMLREEAPEQGTIAFRAPNYPGHLERAQWLNDAQLPLSADARARVTAVLREDAERRKEICRIAQFAEDVRDWKRRYTLDAQWIAAGAALLERGRRAEEDIPHFCEHLEADTHLDTKFATALGVLEAARFATVHARMRALARERQAMPRHLEEYEDVYRDATKLVEDGSIILPDVVRELVDEVLRHAPEERSRAVHEPQTQHARSETVAAAPPSAQRAPQPRSTTVHEAVPGAGDVCRTGEPLILESFEMARQQVEIERQDRQAEAETRNVAKRLQEEQESATKRKSGSGRRM